MEEESDCSRLNILLKIPTSLYQACRQRAYTLDTMNGQTLSLSVLQTNPLTSAFPYLKEKNIKIKFNFQIINFSKKESKKTGLNILQIFLPIKQD